MTKEDRGHYSAKHGEGKKPDPGIEAALRRLAPGGEVPCAVAFKIAADLDTDPGSVGTAADLLEMRLVKCQLGLFGYQSTGGIVKPAIEVSAQLEQAVREGLEDGRLPCREAWKIAEKLGIGKMEVSSACDTLGIKICSCQLGAF